jgi:hypothetical protein
MDCWLGCKVQWIRVEEWTTGERKIVVYTILLILPPSRMHMFV